MLNLVAKTTSHYAAPKACYARLVQHRDYLERLIAQIASAIARMTGLVDSGSLREAEAELDAAWSAIGFRKADVDRLDDATLALLVGAKAPWVAKLLDAHALIDDKRGLIESADELRRRAARLRH